MRATTVAVLGGTAILALGLAGVARPAAAKHGSPQLDLSRARGVQNEPAIAVDPANPNLLVAASQDLSVCGIRVYTSDDGGKRWSSRPLPVAGASPAGKAAGKFCAVNEWVAAGRGGRQYVVFIDNGGKTMPGYGVYLASRTYPHPWPAPGPVDPTLTGSDLNDKPVVTVDGSPSSPHEGRIYVAWTRWTVFGVDGEVLLAYSDDQGQSWSAPITVAPAQGANWGIHLAVAADGTLYATAWNASAAGDLWITRSTDGGTDFQPLADYASRVGSVTGDVYVPAEPTQPMQEDASLAVDTSSGRRGGSVYTAYSRATRNGYRVVVERFGGDLAPALRQTIAVRRTRRTYDEFDPTIAVDESSGAVWACFYLTGTGKQRKLATYSCVDSRNGGHTWSRVIGGASAPSNETLHGAFNRLGLVDNDVGPYEGLAVSDGIAHPIWTDTRNLARLKEEIYSTRVRTPR